MKLRRAEILVSGLVQGVGYRFFAERVANRHGLVGFCRNLANGTVEIVAEGDHGLLSDYVKELRRGPASGDVSAVDVKWADYSGEFKDFRIQF